MDLIIFINPLNYVQMLPSSEYLALNAYKVTSAIERAKKSQCERVGGANSYPVGSEVCKSGSGRVVLYFKRDNIITVKFNETSL